MVLVFCTLGSVRAETVTVNIPTDAAPRVEFGAERLAVALTDAGFEPTVVRDTQQTGTGRRISINTTGDAGREGFALRTVGEEVVEITGGDDSGALYGCLELAKRIREAGGFPDQLDFSDQPVLKLRGPCIGMQKTELLPGRKVYEYPYSPELFPFFYDKEHWREFLDFLVENRMNTLYLWNGHPFASLVRVPEYRFAVEVPEEVFQQNVEMLHWITEECDRRGIWLVQMFYSLLVSKPFAEHYGIETQLHAPTPEALDYTRKSIAQFVKEYPNVGLLVCLGEALQGIENQTSFLTDTVLAGVKDGMDAAQLKEQPPVVVRAHATDPDVVMPAAVQVYSNVFTMAKYNGESLTTWQPRGEWQRRHLAMSRLASNHVANVHILANLEPFRYGAQRFIQKSVQASRDRFGATGLHLYPLFYWDWPVSPDIAQPRLKQWARDWIWFEAWARYSWDPDIPAAPDRDYWIGRLTEKFGTRAAAEKILDAYNDAGECAPRILRRFGITEGNRQTMSLGMTLDQLVNDEKYRPYEELWKSQSPPGERLDEYAKKEWNNEPHEGETPPQVVRDVLEFSQKALTAIENAAPHVTKNREEFDRLRNDVHCIRAITENYAEKVKAAMLVLRYQFSRDLTDMEQAETHLARSFEAFQRLTDLTKDTYHFANSMQTSQRKIPFVGGFGGVATNHHWTHLVDDYQHELEEFRTQIARIRETGNPLGRADESNIEPWPTAAFRLISSHAETYTVNLGAKPFADRDYAIRELAPEVRGLTGIRFSHTAAKEGRLQSIEFEVSEPVRVLVGYFQNPRPIWLQVPDLEIAAHADERGGVEPVLRNAASIEESPSVNVHAFRYEPGRHRLELIGSGSFVVLGVVPEGTKLEPRDAMRKGVQE
jgi:hypothetical protein